jgi:cyanophycinase
MGISQHGTVALVGSGEYLPTILPVDRYLLTRIAAVPRVVVLPTAAVPDGATVAERWARMGVEHFTKLEAQVEAVMLNTRADAEDAAIIAKLAEANFIYFSGGKPGYLLETLQGTQAWAAIEHVFANGGVLAGCSAGAMVLGGEFFDFPQVWRTRPALGVVPGIAVIPHFDEIPSFFADNAIKAAAGKVTVVGIEGATALVGSRADWTVRGTGGVTLFVGRSKTRYTEGQAVPLPPLPG